MIKSVGGLVGGYLTGVIVGTIIGGAIGHHYKGENKEEFIKQSSQSVVASFDFSIYLAPNFLTACASTLLLSSIFIKTFYDINHNIAPPKPLN